MINIEPSKNLSKIPPYLFTKINQIKREAYDKNLDVIDLSMGNPDLPTPGHIVDRLCDTVKHHSNTHRYPQAKGMPKFRKAITEWMARRFGVELDPENEVLSLIGSKEGIAHLCMSYLNSSDCALVCDPAYPVHFNAVALSGAKVYSMPLLERNNFLPDFTKIPKKTALKAKIMLLNYPNNPTATVVEDNDFWKEAIKFCKKYDILLVSDNAYSELTFGDYYAPSVFEFQGAKDVALEFHSFSKTFNMAGWRLGWVCGAKKLLYPLEKFKSFLDYGAPTFMQLAGIAALNGQQDCIRELSSIYERRMKKMVNGLQKIGWRTSETKGTMYIWAELPNCLKKEGSLSVAERLVKETGVVISPGAGFGKHGEGYVRMSLVTHDKRFHDALLRIGKFTKSELNKQRV
ncbi:MAG: aminotransferase class I/II-fold pyridoxal phosphate-dependent enzyme [Endomicrobium sp.]|uniref:aminotransferase class I/II-fold pyridoxal phosphate-dependent enzyme n=1 Tax=Candidatus Endomicrobiellum pyrsonymphae TaxID=1408203 RepID=UPI003582F8D8|nr:aminotransferase class I/II-fold pyridoxal phosphate-dependent enzyme [Endomicrobium sp.]